MHGDCRFSHIIFSRKRTPPQHTFSITADDHGRYLKATRNFKITSSERCESSHCLFVFISTPREFINSCLPAGHIQVFKYTTQCRAGQYPGRQTWTLPFLSFVTELPAAAIYFLCRKTLQSSFHPLHRRSLPSLNAPRTFLRPIMCNFSKKQLAQNMHLVFPESAIFLLTKS